MLWEKTKSLIAASAITVLIWLAADQNVQQEQEFRLTVRLVSRDPARFAEIVEPAQQPTLVVKMSGRRRHLKEFSDLVGERRVLEAIMNERQASDPRPQAVSTETDILQRIPEVSRSRLVIKSVLPEKVSILVDDYITLTDLAVEPSFGDLQVNAGVSPSKVSARLPMFAQDQLPPDRVIRLNAAALARQALQENPDAQEFKVTVPITLAARTTVPIEFIPDKVTVTGVVESRHATAVKGPVQVTFSIPAEVQSRFSVVPDRGSNLRQSIELTGPAKLLEELDPREIRAFVDVMAADMDEPGKPITRPVQYILPPGVSLAADSPPQNIVFRLVPRSAPAAEP